jgi:hypothetical protein
MRRMLFKNDRPGRDHVSREEQLRQERLTVGRICRCGTCQCCMEVKNHEMATEANEEVACTFEKP